MSTSRILLVTTTVLAFGTLAHAQPNPYGCHYFRHGAAPHPTATDADRTQIAETIARSDTFDILHYDIALDVTDNTNTRIKAATTVTFRALLANVPSIRFDLFELVVDSVLENGEQRTFTYDDQFLRVDFSTIPAVGEERTLTIYYHGTPHRDPDWGGFYFESGYIYNLGIGISSIPPNFGKVWYPCFDSFVERATYTYHVKSSGTYRLQGQGTFMGEIQLGGDTVIRSYDLPQPIPTHLSAVAVANYVVDQQVHTGINGTIPVTLAAKAANIGNMVTKFAELGAAIDACEYWYGPYAYDRVGYVLTTDGALEIPTNVAYPDFMPGQSASANRDLYSHELGHHWWGDIVTPYIHNDMWLKEGPAEYTGHLVSEWVGGNAALIKAVKDNQLYVLKQAHVNDGGFQALSPMPDEYIYGTHTYYKGAAVVHNLRGYLGEAAFRQAMRTVQIDHANSTITSVGFKEALEQATGQDLDPFFDAWVFAPGFATFEVQDHVAQQVGGAWNVDLTIGQRLRGTTVYHQQVPLDVTFISSEGQTHEAQVVVGTEFTSVTVASPFEPAMVVLNRYARLNQNRMDHEEVIVPGTSFTNSLPFVDFRAYGDVIVDTTLLRVDHVWAAPEQQPLATGILSISGVHYWNVDGLWPAGTVLRGRLFYYGNGATTMDVDLINGDESGIAVLYRAQPGDQWEVYADQEVQAGSLTNGTGYITMNNLRKGQYAFGKIIGFVGIDEHPAEEEQALILYPVPASGELTVSGTMEGDHLLVMDMYDVSGRRVDRTTLAAKDRFNHTMDISGLAVGTYTLRVLTSLGYDLGTRQFEVAR